MGTMRFWSYHLGWPTHLPLFSRAWIKYSTRNCRSSYWCSLMISLSTIGHGRTIWDILITYWESWERSHYIPRIISVSSTWKRFYNWAMYSVKRGCNSIRRRSRPYCIGQCLVPLESYEDSLDYAAIAGGLLKDFNSWVHHWHILWRKGNLSGQRSHCRHLTRSRRLCTLV